MAGLVVLLVSAVGWRVAGLLVQEFGSTKEVRMKQLTKIGSVVVASALESVWAIEVGYIASALPA